MLKASRVAAQIFVVYIFYVSISQYIEVNEDVSVLLTQNYFSSPSLFHADILCKAHIQKLVSA